MGTKATLAVTNYAPIDGAFWSAFRIAINTMFDGTSAIVDLLKSTGLTLAEKDADTIKKLRVQFASDYIEVYYRKYDATVKNADDAIKARERCLATKKADRTKMQYNAYRAQISAWQNVLERAGLKAEPVARVAKPKADTPAPVVNEPIVAIKTLADLRVLCEALANELLALVNATASIKTEGFHAVMTDAARMLKAGVKAKPVKGARVIPVKANIAALRTQAPVAILVTDEPVNA